MAQIYNFQRDNPNSTEGYARILQQFLASVAQDRAAKQEQARYAQQQGEEQQRYVEQQNDARLRTKLGVAQSYAKTPEQFQALVKNDPDLARTYGSLAESFGVMPQSPEQIEVERARQERLRAIDEYRGRPTYDGSFSDTFDAQGGGARINEPVNPHTAAAYFRSVYGDDLPKEQFEARQLDYSLPQELQPARFGVQANILPDGNTQLQVGESRRHNQVLEPAQVYQHRAAGTASLSNAEESRAHARLYGEQATNTREERDPNSGRVKAEAAIRGAKPGGAIAVGMNDSATPPNVTAALTAIRAGSPSMADKDSLKAALVHMASNGEVPVTKEAVAKAHRTVDALEGIKQVEEALNSGFVDFNAALQAQAGNLAKAGGQDRISDKDAKQAITGVTGLTGSIADVGRAYLTDKEGVKRRLAAKRKAAENTILESMGIRATTFPGASSDSGVITDPNQLRDMLKRQGGN